MDAPFHPRLVRVVLCLLMSATVACAEKNPLHWPGHEQAADRLSTVLVASQMTLSAAATARQDDQWLAARRLGCDNAIAVAAVEMTKHVVHRTRPDGSDSRSFYSEHTTLLAVNRGWQVGVGWTFTLGGGALRTVANKHYPSDVVVGLLAGLGVDSLCREIYQ